MNGMTAGLHAALGHQAHRDELHAVAYVALKSEFLAAFRQGSKTKVRTPDGGRAEEAIGDVFIDDICAATPKSQARLNALMFLLQQAADEGNVGAQMFIETMAGSYAEWHCGAAADQEG